MTVFVPEGISRSGKSTVMDQLREERPDWIYVKNFNMVQSGIQQGWLEDWFEYHKYGYLMANQNPDNVWFHDRFFTEAVYNPDELVRKEALRLSQGFPNTHLLFFDASDEELKERGTKDAWRLEEIRDRYRNLMRMLPYAKIDTEANSVDQCVQAVIEYVEDVHDNTATRPEFPG